MRVAVTDINRDSLITENLINGLQQLGYQATFIPMPKSLTKKDIEDLLSYDIIQDVSQEGSIFSVLRPLTNKVVWYIRHYWIPTEYRGLIVAMSFRHAQLLERAQTPYEPAFAPRYTEENRYAYCQGVYFIYPDLKLEGIKPAQGTTPVILAGLSYPDLTADAKTLWAPLFKKYPVLYLGKNPEEWYKQFNCLILDSVGELVECLTAANMVFYITNTHIPFPLMLMIPLAMGLPVISTPFGGIIELITHGKNGYIIHHPNEIERAIETCKNIKGYLPKQFIYPKMAERFASLYEKVKGGMRIFEREKALLHTYP